MSWIDRESNKNPSLDIVEYKYLITYKIVGLQEHRSVVVYESDYPFSNDIVASTKEELQRTYGNIEILAYDKTKVNSSFF